MDAQKVNAFLKGLEALTREHGLVLSSQETIFLEELQGKENGEEYGYIGYLWPWGESQTKWDDIEWRDVSGTDHYHATCNNEDASCVYTHSHKEV